METTIGERSALNIDVAAERSLTAGTRTGHHFNSAGAALASRGVIETVVGHLRLEELEGGYEAGSARRDRVEAIYTSAARLIGSEARGIALFDSASTGLRVLIDALRLGPAERLVVSRSTYVSHALHLMSIARERGTALVIVPNGADGAIDLAELDLELGRGPGAVVCVAHIPTSSGLVEPAAAIGALARKHGARYVLDATQSVGQLDVDVAEIGCDMLVTTGRKFLRAPRGTGFSYIRPELLEALLPTAPDVRGAVWTSDSEWSLVDTARRFETWESSVAGRLGLGAAIDEALARGMGLTQTHLQAQARELRSRLTSIPSVTIADPPAGTSAIVTFTVDGVVPESVVARLSLDGVRAVSVPASHAQWDLGDRGLPSVVRASIHVYNDQGDLDALVAGVAAIAAAPAL